VAASPVIGSPNTDPELTAAADVVTPKKGRFDLVIHGNANNLWVRTGPGVNDWAKVSLDRIALLLPELGYKGGPIRLIACETGSCATGVAQRLADRLRAPILAPTHKVWIWPTGRLTLGPHYTLKMGSWVWFRPGKKQ